MAKRTKANFDTTIAALFPDNTSKAITPAFERSAWADATDSFLFQLNRKSIDVSIGSPVLDFENLSFNSLFGSASIGSPKTFSVSNATNIVRASFYFEMAATYNLTFPASFFFPTFLAEWETAGSKILTLDVGKYWLDIIFDGTNYYATLNGPY